MAGIGLIDHLSDAETAILLKRLLVQDPDLASTAAVTAQQLLTEVDAASISSLVTDAFAAQPVTAIAARVGRVPGGYIDENEARWAALEETLQPFLADIRRRAQAGFPDAAVQVALAVVAALHGLRDGAPDGSLLAWGETQQDVRDLASSIPWALRTSQIALSAAAVEEVAPGWGRLFARQ